MATFSGWRQKKDVDRGSAPQSLDWQMRNGLLEAWVSIIGNSLLFLIKFWLGILTHSIAITADAFHTLTDTLSSMIVLIGFKFGTKEPDQEHPYGHGRFDMIATLAIAILLILTGAEFLKTSLERFRRPVAVSGNWWIMLIIFGTALCKEGMARFSWTLGKKIDSSTLKVEAWHHRSDALTSLLVVLGNFAVSRGWNWVDPLLGVIISLVLIYIGYQFALASGNRLMGQLPAEMVEEISHQVKKVDGIEEVHQIKVHDYGTHKEVSLQIEVDERMDLMVAHHLSEMVEQVITEKFEAEPVVHIEPKAVKAKTERIACLENSSSCSSGLN